MEFFSENLQSDSNVQIDDLTAALDGGKLDEAKLSALALKIWAAFSNSFLAERERAKKRLSHIAGEEEESIQRAKGVIEGTAALEDIQTGVLKSLSGATDLGSSVLKEVKDLRDFIAHISDSVKNINDIAERVHVLSLNAAIEAARAGERGKGFAVVSSEIRSLAGSTAQRVDEISEYIRQSASTVERVVEGIHSTVGNVNSTHQQLSGTTEKIKKIEGVATKVRDEVKRNYIIRLVENLRGEHSALRVKVYQALLKNTPLSEDKIPNGHNCPLGKWYKENKGVSAFSDLTIYQQLEDPHERFHLSIDKIREAIASNDAQAIASHMEDLEAANKEISDILLEVIKSVH